MLFQLTLFSLDAFCSMTESVTQFLFITGVILTQKDLERIVYAARHCQTLSVGEFSIEIESELDFSDIESSNLSALDICR